MKSFEQVSRAIFFGCIVLGTVGALAPGLTFAEGKGASKLLFPAVTPKNQHAPAPVSSMTCPRCVDSYTKVADISAKGTQAGVTRVSHSPVPFLSDHHCLKRCGQGEDGQGLPHLRRGGQHASFLLHGR